MKGLFAPTAGTFTFRVRWIRTLRRRRWWERRRLERWDATFTPALNIAPGVEVNCELPPPPPYGPRESDVVVTFARIRP